MLSCLGSFQASACMKPIDLVVIEQRIADPNLGNELAEKSKTLKAQDTAAIEAGHRGREASSYWRFEVADITSHHAGL